MALRQLAPASAAARRGASLLTWVGSLLVAGSGVLHFFLWLNYGYSKIPTIGPLFLMQAVVAVLVAAAAIGTRHWLVVLGEAGFVISTALGLVLSINIGLFGWQETLDGPWVWLALLIEFLAGALLAASGVLLGWPVVAALKRGRAKQSRSQQPGPGVASRVHV